MAKEIRIHPKRNGSIRGACWLPEVAVVMLGLLVWAQAAVGPSPPEAKRADVVDTYSGAKVPDPYRWLENQTSPETRAWIERENAYSRSLLSPLPGRQHIEQELAQLMKVDETNLPLERNGRYFFSRRLANQDLFVIYMRPGLYSQDEVLIDPHPLTADHTVSVGIQDVSQDGALMVYGLRQGGQDETSLRFFDVRTRKNFSDQLPKALYESASLEANKSGLFYARDTPDGPRVYHHKIGTDPARDEEVFGKGYGKDKIILSSLSEDGRYLIMHVYHGSAGDQTEIYFQDLSKRGPIRPVVTDIAARFEAHAAGEKLFVHTNWEAPNGRIIAVDLADPSRDRWTTVVPESEAVIDDLSLGGGGLFVSYLKDARSELKMFGPNGRRIGDISLPTLGTVTSVSGQWKSPDALFAFTSFHLPRTIVHYQVGEGKQDIWAETKIPVDTEKLRVEQVWYTSRDGTRVPMFLFHAQGIKLDGSNPTLLTGYGGFNWSQTPWYSALAILWAERGGIYAVANLRGGGEFGEKWHRAGMLANKQNVFDDFIAAAEWLIQNRYTRPSRLSIMGTSNGGLLVGAALTQRPELFQAALCRYPLLDMLRYQNFLVARFWVSEYGSAENPDQFKYLYAYSPYQNVKRGTNYPAVLLVSGDGDTRVDPLHARKMTAMLQWATGSDRPVLLLYDTKSGHSGGRPLKKQIEELTDETSFLFWQLGTPQGRLAP